jgi:hypothetical protein
MLLFAFLAFFCVTLAHAEIIPGSSKPPEIATPIDLGDKVIGGRVDAPHPLEPRLGPFTETNPGADIRSSLPHDVHSGPATAPSAAVPVTSTSDALLLALSEFDERDREREEADEIFGYVFMTLMGLGTIGVLMLLFTRQPVRLALPRWVQWWR